MIVVALTAIGVVSALLSRRRLKRFASLQLQGLWLVWLAILVQVVVFEVLGQHIPMWSSNVLHLVSYVLCVGFLWRNRSIRGSWIIAIGTACNLIVISANGGTMPANAAAWKRAGLPEFEPGVFENSRALTSPRLAFLGDIFAIPADWPLANVFSVGDVLIVIGGTYLAHRWCSAAGEPRADTEIDIAIGAAGSLFRVGGAGSMHAH